MYSFWYQWIEEVHTYTLVANIGVSGILYRKNPGKGPEHPPSEDVLQKHTSGGRELNNNQQRKILFVSDILCQGHF